MDPLTLRSKNPFLAQLEVVAPECQAYMADAVRFLPNLSACLSDFARFHADSAVERYNRRTTDMNRQFLFLCVHDVQITRVIAFLEEATHDRALAETYASALLFQAVGKIPKCDDQSIFLGLSYRLRGWEKYPAAARILRTTGDPIGATFGREFATLIFGRASEDVMLLGRSKLEEIGLYADANLRGLFLGEIFGEEERALVEAKCAEEEKRVTREIQEWRKRNPN